MKHMNSLYALGVATLMSGCVVIASSPSRADFHQQKDLTIDAQALTAMEIEAGAGSLIIRGDDNITEIKVTADIYTDRKHQDAYELTLDKSGKTGYLVAKNYKTSGFWNGNSPHINVVVTMPTSLALDVNDGSGDMKISNISSDLYINDGSGDIEVTNIGGSLNIKDASGGMEISNIGNRTNINDGSGEIEISHINGTLDIVDGSGEIDVEYIEGNLLIDDGSGTIHASNINGDAKIDDGSGDLTVKQVTGIITIDDSSGSIDVDTAGGLKILDSGSGGLRVNNVKGGFDIDS